MKKLSIALTPLTIKKTLLIIILCLIYCFIYCFILKSTPSHKKVRTEIFGQYNVWVGTSAFSNSNCTNKYEEIQDKIKYIDLCSELENIIFKTQVVRIEKGECSCYKTEYK